MERVRQFFSALILIMFVFWIAYIIEADPSRFVPLFHVEPLHLLILVVIFSIQMLLSGLYLRDVLAANEIRIPAREWMALPFVSGFLNLTLPARGGTGFRALYVYTTHAFPLSAFLAAFLVYNLIFVGIHGLTGSVSVLALNRWNNEFIYAVLLGFLAVALGPVLVMVLTPRINTGKGKLSQYLSRVLNAVNEFRHRPGLFLRTIANVSMVMVLTMCQYGTAFYACGVSVTFSECVFFVCARNLAMLIGLTPGSLGTTEILMVLVGRFMDIAIVEVLMVQTVIRLVSFASLSIYFPIGLRFLSINPSGLKKLLKSGRSGD